MLMDNVVFVCPWKKNNTPSEQEAAVDEAVGRALQHLAEMGYSIKSEQDIGLICVSFASGIERTMGIKHPLQELADKTIVLT